MVVWGKFIGPALQCVGERPVERQPGHGLADGGLGPLPERLHERPEPLVPRRLAPLGRHPVELGVDAEDAVDAAAGLEGDRVGALAGGVAASGLDYLRELAAHVHEAVGGAVGGVVLLGGRFFEHGLFLNYNPVFFCLCRTWRCLKTLRYLHSRFMPVSFSDFHALAYYTFLKLRAATQEYSAEAATKGKKVGNVGCFPVKGLYDRMHHPDFPDDARRPVVLKKPSLCPPRNEKDRPGVPATMIQGNRKSYHAALSHTSPVSFRQKHDC